MASGLPLRAVTFNDDTLALCVPSSTRRSPSAQQPSYCRLRHTWCWPGIFIRR
ncbi:hypothetical protein KCP76_22205 [Salmonella enterica subsp. enterica serovar Weltevreden]|nr:hypothetical protein KCP76_22205 [Salmonella enterica subsp. enterica serovar Weltevreden]